MHLLIFAPQIPGSGQVAACIVRTVPMAISEEIAPAGYCSQERGLPGLAICSRWTSSAFLCHSLTGTKWKCFFVSCWWNDKVSSWVLLILYTFTYCCSILKGVSHRTCHAAVTMKATFCCLAEPQCGLGHAISWDSLTLSLTPVPWLSVWRCPQDTVHKGLSLLACPLHCVELAWDWELSKSAECPFVNFHCLAGVPSALVRGRQGYTLLLWSKSFSPF